MDISELAGSSLLLFVLLNPFLMSVYLMDLIQDLSAGTFFRVLVRGALVSFFVFLFFSYAGESAFTLLGGRFASFLFFGGVVFLLIGIRFVFMGSEAIREIRGKADYIEGSIALPFMIGPGTVSASVLVGTQNNLLWSAVSIFTSLFFAVVSLFILKIFFDLVRERYATFMERYIDIVGRIGSLLIGTIAVDMIFQALELWIDPRFFR